MKYLRKYNEELSRYPDKECDPAFFLKLERDFRKLTNECLAFLVDEGFTISITIGSYMPDLMLLNSNKFFTWDDIKEDFIPYMEMVTEKFQVLNEFSQPIYIITTEGNYTLSINDIIHDHVGNVVKRQIRGIQFKIKDYKDGSD